MASWRLQKKKSSRWRAWQGQTTKVKAHNGLVNKVEQQKWPIWQKNEEDEEDGWQERENELAQLEDNTAGGIDLSPGALGGVNRQSFTAHERAMPQ